MRVLQERGGIVDIAAEEQLRRNVLELMKVWKLTQAQLAKKLGKSQPWLSRRLAEDGDHSTRFQFSDLDLLGKVFGLSPAELLQPKYGKWDRRSGRERRTGIDRRGFGRPGMTDQEFDTLKRVFGRPIYYGNGS